MIINNNYQLNNNFYYKIKINFEKNFIFFKKIYFN